MTKQEENKLFALTSFLYGGNADYIDALYAVYEKDPNSVDADWRDFFASLRDDKADVLKNAEGASWQRENWPLKPAGEMVAALDGDWSRIPEPADKSKGKGAKAAAKPVAAAPALSPAAPAASAADVEAAARDSARALALIHAYQSHGHLRAHLDPLSFAAKPEDYHLLSPEHYGFTAADYDRTIFINGALGMKSATLRQILERLQALYCGTIGAEFMHITDPRRRAWVEVKLASAERFSALSRDEKKRLLQRLIEAEGFEKFLDTKYKGTKRFGLDGGESMIPAMDAIIRRAVQSGAREVEFGMAHRGRLNVLTQILKKPHAAMFHEFKGGMNKPADVPGSGDVKYHLGWSLDDEVEGQAVHMSLLPNPSHLEIADPVLLGKTRARQDDLAGAARRDCMEGVDYALRDKILPILIHGDAAFAGQGVVAEMFALSNLKGYTVGGQVHFIVNNQIGFTTNVESSRSGVYASEPAKMIEAPIFHVNGDDPEAVLFVSALAAEYRHEFHVPVVVDMICYRRYGHNEGDEPSFTQPLMYKNIRAHKSVVEIYGEKLIAEGVITAAELEAGQKAWHDKMAEAFDAGYEPKKADWLDGAWKGIVPSDGTEEQSRGKTGLPIEKLREIGEKLTQFPEGFQLHRTVERVMDNRRKMMESGEGLDWGMGEALAFGSLVAEGHPIRLSGEDVERGTFSHRHSVVYDQGKQARYIPLNHIAAGQALYEPVNSLLSEEAVLAYEYGYSLANPNNLTIWEAQFGDFANGAQTVFDQFISAAEQKWLRMSGLVCLLPHGFEGQGPEHSSARLERYLQLCAEDNMQVANCTTPANYFHILRRQLVRNFRKPLLVMTPKSLLRHKRAVSALSEMAEGSHFRSILADDAERLPNADFKLTDDENIRRVILCSGKVYYDLYEERAARELNDIYILRLEQLYPFPAQALVHFLERFKNAEIIWCQEEPKNMGAWTFANPYIEWVLRHIDARFKRVQYAGRPASASPATGLGSIHKAEIAAFLSETLKKDYFEA